MKAQIQRLLAPNRTEEIGYDVWQEYVLPPFFSNLTFGDSKKPRVIVGGRGCGKTMLLRYLSHESTFSLLRPSIDQDALSHVGLYWRSDTQFASLMQHRGVPTDTWDTAFRHLAAVVLGIELLRSLESIARSTCHALSEQDVASLDFGRLHAYRIDMPSAANDVRDYLEDCLAEFESWANNVRAATPPVFLPGDKFLKRMVALIQQQLPTIDPLVFFVYIDEFENLAEYQQRIINTWMKHSEPPLIFNVATKRNGFKTYSTDGSESLSATHDYRCLDLENFDLEREFPVFAGEILLLRLQLGGVDIPVINPDQLRDVEQVASRKETSYARKVQATLKTVFPGLSQRELAAQVLSDKTLNRRLSDKIVNALKKRGESADRRAPFLSDTCPEASIVIPALFNRESLSVDNVADEFAKLLGGDDNRFTGSTNWVHNNFIGCYLQLFDGLGRPCPFYSGFETFCYMARGNLRHFLELCHKALSRTDNVEVDASTVISVE
ncbi:MAG: hypothetical protein KDB27_28210, partial [Planctomycetales bacterium]|nr:hypothetical protein [Planctomycetales bacterium]